MYESFADCNVKLMDNNPLVGILKKMHFIPYLRN